MAYQGMNIFTTCNQPYIENVGAAWWSYYHVLWGYDSNHVGPGVPGNKLGILIGLSTLHYEANYECCFVFGCSV